MHIEYVIDLKATNAQIQRMIDALTVIEDAQNELAAFGMSIDIKM